MSARLTDLEREAINGKDSIAILNVKLKATAKKADDFAYERDGLQAPLQLSQCKQDKVDVTITCIQYKIDHFSSKLKKKRSIWKVELIKKVVKF